MGDTIPPNPPDPHEPCPNCYDNILSVKMRQTGPVTGPWLELTPYEGNYDWWTFGPPPGEVIFNCTEKITTLQLGTLWCQTSAGSSCPGTGSCQDYLYPQYGIEFEASF